MIIIIAKGRIKAGSKDKFVELAAKLVEASQNEDGNIAYHLCEDINDSEVITFQEMWEDQAAIDFHKATKHYTTILPQLGELLDGGIKIDFYKRII